MEASDVVRKSGYYWVKRSVWLVRHWNSDIKFWSIDGSHPLSDDFWQEINENQIIRKNSISEIEKKINIIDEIIKFHPAIGVEKQYSWYVGGMRDTGDWNFRYMLDRPIEELEDFLLFLHQPSELIPPLTGQDLIDRNTIVEISPGVFSNKYDMRMEKVFHDNIELRMRHPEGLNLHRGVNGEPL